MSIKFIDSVKLDNSLTATASAIREKTGSSDEIDFDYDGETGFATAVSAIPAGFTLLSSGTYTQLSDVSNTYVEIPVSTPSTSVYVVVRKALDESGKAYTSLWYVGKVNFSNTYVLAKQVSYHKTDNTTTKAWGQSNGYDGIVVSNISNPTYIRIYPYSGTYKILSGNYNWWIYG